MKTVLAIALSLCLVGMTCVQPPRIVNDLPEPIEIRIAYADGRSTTATVQSGALFWFGSEVHPPTDLILTSSSGRVHARVGLAEAPLLLGSKVAPPLVGWRLSDDGLTTMTEAELRARYKRQ